MKDAPQNIAIGISWCLAWGDEYQPQDLAKQTREALNGGNELPQEFQDLVRQVEKIQQEEFPLSVEELKAVSEKYSQIGNAKVGLVYGGATKIKQYMFESAKIQEIRGASGLLDRINQVDLRIFFNPKYKPKPDKPNLYNAQVNEVRQWLDENFNLDANYKLADALIPELIIYSTGGNILAFCPAAYVDDLANAIEKRYTHETLTANSCAVGEKFQLLELRFGLLREPIENTLWLDWYHQKFNQPLVQAYFGYPSSEVERVEFFQKRKSFNELTTKLNILYNQRRSGNDTRQRPSRRYPPMLETHPYLMRDGSDRRSAIMRVEELPRQPYFSEASVRKYLVGDRAKGSLNNDNPDWYKKSGLTWQRGIIDNWVDKFTSFLEKNPTLKRKYYDHISPSSVKIAETLTEVSNASYGYVAYIYADGNNMGSYIQKIPTPQAYQNFSQDVERATLYAVFQALAENLNPHQLRRFNDEESDLENGEFIHPFEIITIGGDDVFLIVPANKALQISQMIGDEFEKILLKEIPIIESTAATGDSPKITGNYRLKHNQPVELQKHHRYKPLTAKLTQCELSTSIGVLITAVNTPIYYARDLVEQLLKSAKERAKKLKASGYNGGTVDFLTLKSITMISSNVKSFREEALTKQASQKLKFYAAPYTLHELAGLITSISALKKAKFPKSQLYQIRSFLEQGKRTAILNYRYFRVRLKQGKDALMRDFEDAWCLPKDNCNKGNLAPWMYDDGKRDPQHSEDPFYETIWRDMVDVYDFIEVSDNETSEVVSGKIES
ncbi:type III-B CRISPR-associated protein Cas10/Cmr2 [Nostoc sp. TCL26-01]|uniref:type III-B CRISPR-associated protein Cas10/Cmr2 n=1 Tax=Nostoc sp. TCL26-01 TaxID=2576904 RepID=UPI0015B8B99A|nr:type III-B CRISPR-associated protein Cas10/Cmr2 [Nostoc sp. TCL26-01]QLE54770.1 type III-B CRISPR-associated protein Cas10/Cmr2 [Nostoc sp. TCL26-01]